MAATSDYPATVQLSEDVLREIEKEMEPRDTWDDAARRALGVGNE